MVIGIHYTLNYQITLEEVKHYLQEPDYIEYRNAIEIVSCRKIYVWEKRQLVLYSQEYTDIEIVEAICNNNKNQDRPDNAITISVVRYVSPVWIDLHMF